VNIDAAGYDDAGGQIAGTKIGGRGAGINKGRSLQKTEWTRSIEADLGWSRVGHGNCACGFAKGAKNVGGRRVSQEIVAWQIGVQCPAGRNAGYRIDARRNAERAVRVVSPANDRAIAFECKGIKGY